MKQPSLVARLGTIACVLISMFTSASSLHAQLVPPKSSCYGPELELRMTPSDEDLEDGPLLELPYTDIWIVSIGNSTNLFEVPCRREPVRAFQAISPITHGALPQDVQDALGAAGLRLTIVSVHTMSDAGVENRTRSKEFWWENVFSDAPTTPEGHLRKQSVDMDAVGGSWLLTPDYLDETGDRIRVGCALDCVVIYRLRPKLSLRYHLVVSDKTITPDWVAIDRMLRGVFLSWLS